MFYHLKTISYHTLLCGICWLSQEIYMVGYIHMHTHAHTHRERGKETNSRNQAHAHDPSCSQHAHSLKSLGYWLSYSGINCLQDAHVDSYMMCAKS